MSITSDLLRGHTDTIILANLLEHDSYGYQINKAIYTKSDRLCEIKEATLYTAFKRLEKGGFIFSYWGDESTGARRKYYSITTKGRKKYEENLEEWNSVKEIVSKLLMPD